MWGGSVPEPGTLLLVGTGVALIARARRRQSKQRWQLAAGFLPHSIGACRAVGFNERFRFYRYDPTQRFAPHFDGYFSRPSGERSQLTFTVYLNEDFAGGETKFYSDDGTLRFAVRPERGTALIFVHRQLHEGAAVISGRKYVLRTDVMYSAPTA